MIRCPERNVKVLKKTKSQNLPAPKYESCDWNWRDPPAFSRKQRLYLLPDAATWRLIQQAALEAQDTGISMIRFLE